MTTSEAKGLVWFADRHLKLRENVAAVAAELLKHVPGLSDEKATEIAGWIVQGAWDALMARLPAGAKGLPLEKTKQVFQHPDFVAGVKLEISAILQVTVALAKPSADEIAAAIVSIIL